MVFVRLVTFVFLDDDNLGRLMLFLFMLFGLLLMATFTTMGLFMVERMIVMRLGRLLGTVGMSIPGVGMAMGVTVTVVWSALMGVSMVNRRPLTRMDDILPRFTQGVLERVGPRFVAVGTVLT